MMVNKAIYLSNIYYVLGVEKNLTSKENQFIDDIRKEISASKKELNGARKLAEKPEYSLQVVGSFADNVKNLEHVYQAALFNEQNLERKEAHIKKYADQIGLNEQQVQIIYQDAHKSIRQIPDTCPNCKKVLKSEAKFCSECGAQVDTLEIVLEDLEYDIPPHGISIEFAESTAANYPRALEYAKKNEAYRTCVKNKKNWHLAVFDEKDFLKATELATELSGMRNRRIYINGAEQSWNDVFSFTWCVERRKTAFNPQEYCFGKDENQINPWGCLQAQMEWTEYANWFFGSWKKAGIMGKSLIWIMDKDKIKHQIATNLHPYRFCPYLNSDLPDIVIKYLPDEINVSAAKNWTYRKAYEESPGSVKVKTKQDSGNPSYSYYEEFYAIGVAPKGLETLKTIMHKAFEECGIPKEMLNCIFAR